jgi:Uma2 family endonuclease
MSVEEYLEFERNSPLKHEYVGGHLYAMVGASRRHGQIAGNVFFSLRQARRGSGCRVYQSDMQVPIPGGQFYYPDVVVACGKEPDDPYIEDAPCLIVEVLSPNTQAIDRREKLLSYRTIPSLSTYLIIEQDMRSVERHYRDDGGQWQSEFIADGTVSVPCPADVTLTVTGIYDGVAV